MGVSPQDQALYNGYNSGIAFGKMWLPGDFMRSENSLAHYQMDAELQKETTVPAVFIVAREHAKTTMIKAHIVRDFCYTKTNMEKFAEQTECPELANYWREEADKRKPYLYGWVADRQKKSQSNVLYIKDALTKNADIVRTFGNLNGKPKGYQWTTEDIVTIANDKLVSRSNLTSMRGETHSDPIYGTIRYIRVFADDFENEENTRSVKKRDFVANTLMNAIWGAIDKDVGRLIINQTPVHWASLAQQFIEMKEKQTLVPELSKTSWNIYVFPATQPTFPGGVLWHGHYPREKLDRIKAQYIASPKGIQGYMQEYELQVQTSEVSTWTQSHIQIWKGTFTLEYGYPALIINNEIVPVNVFGGCDPATDIDKSTSDFSVIISVAMDALGNYYVLDYVRNRSLKEIGLRDKDFNLISDPGVCDLLFEKYDKYQMSGMTIEDVGMTRGVFNGLQTIMTHTGNYEYCWIPEKPGGREKRNKIKTGLSSAFAMRKIYLMDGMIDLMYEIKTFGPSMSYDDCVPDFSLIQTDDGLRKMKDINVGDYVLTHKGRYKKVTGKGYRFADKIYKIKAVGRLPIYVTNNHSLYTCKRVYQYIDRQYLPVLSELGWNNCLNTNHFENVKPKSHIKKVAHLSSFNPNRNYYKNKFEDMMKYGENRYVEKNGLMYATTYNGTRLNAKFNPIPRYIKYDERFMFVLGYYLAEGSCGKHNVTFASHIREVNIRKFVSDYFEELGLKPQVKMWDNSAVLSFGSVLFKRFFKPFGKSINKKLPKLFMELNPKLQLWIYLGWMAGDGTLKTNLSHIKGNTVSRELANQMFIILTRNGFSPTIEFSERKSKGWGNNQWIVKLSGIGLKKMNKRIPEWMMKDKRANFKETKRNNSSQYHKNNYLLSTIVKTEEIDWNNLVWNLEVEDDESYVVENTIVHNCIESLYYAIMNAYAPTAGRLKVVNVQNRKFDKSRRHRRYEKFNADDVYRTASDWEVGA